MSGVPGTAPQPDPAPGRRRKLRIFVRNVLRIIVPCAIAAGIAVRLTVQDRYPVASAVFYAMPLPMIVLSAVFGAWLFRKWHWPAAVLLVLAAVVALWWKNAAWSRPAGFKAALWGPSAGVLFWNINHPKQCPAALDEQIDRLRPDMVVLAESERLTDSEFERLRARHPEMQIRYLSHGMTVFTRGRAELEKSFSLPSLSHLHRLSVHLTGQSEPWSLTLADFGPWPLTPRDDRIDDVFREAGNRPRSIIAGDFNTPLDSDGFRPWRASWRHGLDDCPAFQGCPESWPLTIPLLAIDHIWLSPDITPITAYKGWSLPTDHAWIFSRFGTQGPEP